MIKDGQQGLMVVNLGGQWMVTGWSIAVSIDGSLMGQLVGGFTHSTDFQPYMGMTASN